MSKQMENFFSRSTSPVCYGVIKRKKKREREVTHGIGCIDGSWVVRKHDRSDRERVAIPKDFRPVLSRNTRFGELVRPAGTWDPWM